MHHRAVSYLALFRLLVVHLPASTRPGILRERYFDASFVEHGFLRTPDGTFTTIDFPGAFVTEVLAINPAGIIVGDFCNAVTCYHGFVRAPDGTFTVFNANAGIPSGINPAGAITGFALTAIAASCGVPTAPSPRSIRRAPSHLAVRHQPSGRDHGILL